MDQRADADMAPVLAVGFLGEEMTTPRTRHLRLIAADIADEHAAETVSGAADEIERLNSISEILEANARVQAQLLADTARERDALREQLVNARKVLSRFADAHDWPAQPDSAMTGLRVSFGDLRAIKAVLIDDQHQSAPPLSGSLPSGESGLSVTTTAGGADTASQTSAQRGEDKC